MKFVGKKKFTIATLDLEYELFLIDISFFTNSDLDLEIYFFQRTLIAFTKAHEISTSILLEYPDFINLFSKDLVVKFSEYIGINNYTIDIVKS